ncbi:putative membrane protein YdjX (TVP38/TMEM64 family) [Natronocella acetinitrilica]|uniref:TVP38/TMEM64 family membrane protein n=1 Tax=Natronocella acetinitrilica TaxID=414046 RepID=A0AAE3KDN1_9GAMM|nr:TVP38/TMEM64 family protein [Natronocella acetinitrilica]MCP1676503.1 putative membrane protein YdjX (TVP38/TMEM64 family) [Natronocella acetinitrilica]
MNRRLASRLGLLLVVGALIAFGIAFRESLSIGMLERGLDDLGAWAPLAFIAAYAIATVAFMPGLIFTIAGGVLFGPVFGTLFSLTGATIGAMLAFLVARYVASDWVAARAGGRLERLIKGVEREGWRFVAFTRLVPVFPFNILNYALGLTRIGFMPYALATFICMAPGAFAYTWVGHAGAETVAGGRSGIQAILIAIGLLAAVIFLPRLIRRVKTDPSVEQRDETKPATSEGGR